jgi:hypothetical protein
MLRFEASPPRAANTTPRSGHLNDRPLRAKSRRSPLLLSVAYQMLGVDDGKANVVLTERVEERLLALHLRKIVEIAVPPEEFE